MDRLGRSLRHLIDTITALHAKGVGFKSLTENIDTTINGGKPVFRIFGALAEFEREIISAKEVQMLRNMAADKSLTVSDVCKTLGIGQTTFYRYVKLGENGE